MIIKNLQYRQVNRDFLSFFEYFSRLFPSSSVQIFSSWNLKNDLNSLTYYLVHISLLPDELAPSSPSYSTLRCFFREHILLKINFLGINLYYLKERALMRLRDKDKGERREKTLTHTTNAFQVFKVLSKKARNLLLIMLQH